MISFWGYPVHISQYSQTQMSGPDRSISIETTKNEKLIEIHLGRLLNLPLKFHPLKGTYFILYFYMCK